MSSVPCLFEIRFAQLLTLFLLLMVEQNADPPRNITSPYLDQHEDAPGSQTGGLVPVSPIAVLFIGNKFTFTKTTC